MGESSNDVTTVALVVSLVALLVTAAQLLAQVFATADGARKCSDSVLGPWSVSKRPNTRTIWRSRWREGRLETFYTAPHISLTSSERLLVPRLYDPLNGISRPEYTAYPLYNNPIHLNPDQHPSSSPSWYLKLWEIFLFNTRGSILLPPDAVLGGDSDLDTLLFNRAYEERLPDRAGWIDFLTFLRVELEICARSEVIQQRSWDCYPSKPNAKPEGSQASPIAIAPNAFSWPKIRYVRHSWDFMPTDTGKPLATSTLGDIALIVRRTGMIWKIFKPEEGRMSAEGGPHVITSVEQRGLGIVLQYRCIDNSLNVGVRKAREKGRKKAKQETTGLVNTDMQDAGAMQAGSRYRTSWKFLPWARKLEDRALFWEQHRELSEADASDTEVEWSPNRFLNWVNMDKILFGLVPADPALDIPDFPQNTKDDCINTLAELSDDADTMRNHLRNWAWCERYEFNDLLQLVPETFRQRGKGRFPFPTREYNASIFFWGREGFVTLLARYLNKEAFIDTLPAREDGGTEKMHYIREKMGWVLSSGTTLPELDEKQNLHEETTRYFVGISDKIRFHDLLRAHLSSAPYASKQARTDLDNNNPGSLGESKGHRWRLRNIELYFSYIPKYVAFMKKSARKRCSDDNLIIEAWLMLMFRGFLLKELHVFPGGEFEGEFLPRKYYRSRLPVWLS